MLVPRLRSSLPAFVISIRDHPNQSRRWQTTASTVVEPPSASGHSSSVASSNLLRVTRDSALRTPGVVWPDNEPVRNVVGGRETRKMNLYQAVRDALR